MRARAPANTRSHRRHMPHVCLETRVTHAQPRMPQCLCTNSTAVCAMPAHMLTLKPTRTHAETWLSACTHTRTRAHAHARVHAHAHARRLHEACICACACMRTHKCARMSIVRKPAPAVIQACARCKVTHIHVDVQSCACAHTNRSTHTFTSSVRQPGHTLTIKRMRMTFFSRVRKHAVVQVHCTAA